MSVEDADHRQVADGESDHQVADEQAHHLLVVDERESCRASFMPEDTLLQIWKEPEQRAKKEEKCPEFEEECTEFRSPKTTKQPKHTKEAKKATQNPLFRRKVQEVAIVKELKEATPKEEVEDIGDNQGAVIVVTTDQKLLPSFNGISQNLIEAPRCCFGKFVRPIYKFIIRYVWTMPNVIISLFGNKLTWNILSVVLKILLAIFVYLVLACSTLLVSVIIFSYDSFYRDEEQVQNKHIQNLAHQSVRSEETV